MAGLNIKRFVDSDVVIVDTETTGLRPYHGDILFSIILGTLDGYVEYFNFNDYPDEQALNESYLVDFQELFSDPTKTFVMQNAKFDLAMLANEHIAVAGKVIDTMVLGRIEHNDHFSYGLNDMAKRLGGTEKLDTVEKYITEHKLWEWKTVPGQSRRFKDKFYNEVPFDIIKKYGIGDVAATTSVFDELTKSIVLKDNHVEPSRTSMATLAAMEFELTKVLFSMESIGVKIDRKFCEDSKAMYESRLIKCTAEFKKITGHEFVKGSTLFKEIFKDETWVLTEKGNPQFNTKALKTFKHPAAKLVVEYSEAKKQLEYYDGFLYHADEHDVIHTDYRQSGTVTGRLSSRSPNLQNLTKPDKYEGAGVSSHAVRAAFVPREGYFFAMLDYQQAEYRAMLDMCGADGLIDKVLGGLDVHQATADIAGVSRQAAKTVNFLTLYGGGIAKLADGLGVTEDIARKTQAAIFDAAPAIKRFIRGVIKTAEARGYIFNKYGRRSYFPNKNFCYKAPNHLIQGLCADITKTAMVQCHEFLDGYKSRLLLTIHDELVFEIAFGEEEILPKLQTIMGGVYTHKRLPQGVDIDYSLSNLSDKKTWEGSHGKEARDSVQGSCAEASGPTTQLLGREDSANHH